MTNKTMTTIDQNYLVKSTVRPLLSSIEVARPGNGVFFRSHPDPAFSFDLLILENQFTSPHVVSPSLEGVFDYNLKRKTLTTVITSYGEIKLMPRLKIYKDNWNKSAHRAIELSRSEWIQMTSNRSKHTYEISSSGEVIPPPIWPNVTPEEIFDAAFDKQYIDHVEHSLARKFGGKKHVV